MFDQGRDRSGCSFQPAVTNAARLAPSPSIRAADLARLVRFSAYVGNTTARLGIRIHEGVPGQVPECGEPRTIQIAIGRLTKSQTLRRFVRCSHAASQPTCLTGPAESASGKSSPERFAVQASRNNARHRVASKSGELRLRRACGRMVQSPSLSSEDTPLMSCSSVYGFGRKAFGSTKSAFMPSVSGRPLT